MTERLDRTDSVIKPPPVGDSIQITPPDRANTPIIKPGETPPQQLSPAR